MIIRDFHVVSVAVFPTETDAPLLVDANAVLAVTVAPESFQTISGGNTEVLQVGGRVQHQEFTEGCPLDVGWKVSRYRIEVIARSKATKQSPLIDGKTRLLRRKNRSSQ